MHAMYWIFVILTTSVNSASIFVSPSGTDHDDCGDISEPCATLYHASGLINVMNSMQNNIIVRGQNTTQINYYIHGKNATAQHPCLPQAFVETNSTVITFDDSFVQKMSDWYPTICIDYDKNNNATYSNVYMFHAERTELTINNLYIDMIEYSADDISLGIIGVLNEVAYDISVESKLVCNHCVFSNIFHTNADITLLYSARNIEFNHCVFTNIHSINDFIVIYKQTLAFTDVIFRDFTLNESLVHVTTPSLNTEGDYDGGNTVVIKECLFMNIATQIAVIYDQYISCDVSIDNVSFYHINSGSIYRAYYQSNTNVDIANVDISTSQISVSTEQTLYSLFEFRFAETLNMRNISIIYYYDLFAHCDRFDDGDGTIGNATDQYVKWMRVKCENPISFIKNEGPNTNINNLDLRTNISKHDIDLYKDSVRGDDSYVVFMAYRELRDEHYSKNGLILNDGNLSIDTMTIYGAPFSHQVIINSATLFITQLNVLWDIFDPNILQSNNLISQSGLQPVATVINSHLDGGGLWSQVVIYNGYYSSYNTKYERAITAFQARSGQEIIISNCTFIRIGRYWANIGWAVTRSADVEMSPIVAYYVDKSLIIEKSHFSGFHDAVSSVLVYLWGNSQVVLRENVFLVAEDNYYNVTEYDWSDMYALLVVSNNYNVSVYNNNFQQNDINPHTPWLSLEANGYEHGHGLWSNLAPIPSCVSGNNFSNLAYEFYENNITSCFRRDLYLCVNMNCSHGHFGNMNEALYDVTSHINIDPAVGLANFFKLFDYSWSDYDAADFVYAMDNIQINILHNESWHLSLGDYYETLTYGVNLLLLDCLIPHNVEISYEKSCDLQQYDRLQNNSQYIAHFKLLCDPSLFAYASQIINDSHVAYVDHLTPTQIHFMSNSSTYFPGQKLMFHYLIFDKLNLHCYDYTFNHHMHSIEMSQLMVSLHSDQLRLNQVIGIDEDGDCVICNSGVVILGVALYDLDETNIISITTSVINSNLILAHDLLQLHVTSCPVGYGSDPNDFQCLPCPDGTFNLSPNNTDDCESCHQDINDGVACHGGHIYIRHNWWLGFCGDDNGAMVTNICPSSYCCQEELLCEYNNTDTLCAENRDVSIPLCGACVAGYTEAINSPQCLICTDRKQYIWFLKPAILAVAYALYLVFFNNFVDDDDDKERRAKSPQEVGNGRCPHLERCLFRCRVWYLDKDFVLLCQTLILRVLLYYEQALSSVMWPSSSSPIMAQIYAIATVFSLEASIITDTNTEPKCLFDGLTSKKKILLALFPWGLIVLLLLLAFFYEVCRRNFTPNRYKLSNTNFAKAFVGLLIICASQLLSVIFKLLNCQRVGIKRVHFYFGVEECFATATMATGLAFLCFVVVVFVVMLLLTQCATAEKRDNPNFALNNFCKHYKPECYYWEWLVLLRRSLISSYAILYTWNWYPSILVSVLLICLGLHHKFQPFRRETANIAEYAALSGVIIVITIQTSTVQVGHSLDNATLVVLSLFIIVPIIAVIAYIICKLNHMSLSTPAAAGAASAEDDPSEDYPSEIRTLKSIAAPSDIELDEMRIAAVPAMKPQIPGGVLSVSLLHQHKSEDSMAILTPKSKGEERETTPLHQMHKTISTQL